MAGIGTKPSQLAEPAGTRPSIDALLSSHEDLPAMSAAPAVDDGEDSAEPDAIDQALAAPQPELDPTPAPKDTRPSIDSLLGAASNNVPDYSMSMSGSDMAQAEQQAAEVVTPELESLKIRAKLSGARTDKQRMQMLKEEYPNAEIHKYEGDDAGNNAFEIKTTEGKHFITDNKHLNMYDLADLTREGVEGAVDATITALGTAMGTVGSEGTLSYPSYMASSAAGGMAGQMAGDMYSQAMGVQDERSTGNKVFDSTLAGVLGAGGGLVGGYLAKRGVQKAIETAAEDQAVGDLAAKAREETKQALDVFKDLQDNGHLDKDFVMSHMVISDPTVQDTVKAVSDNPRVQNLLRVKGEQFLSAIKSVGKAIGNLGAGEEGVNATGKKVQEFFTGEDGIGKIYGKLIGKHRDDFVKYSGDKPVALDNLKSTLADIHQKIGMSMKNGTMELNEADMVKNIMENKFAANEVDAKELLSDIKKATEFAFNSGGSTTGKQLVAKSEGLKRAAELAYKNKNLTYDAIGFYSSLRKAAENDVGAGIEKYVPDASRAGYVKAKQTYGMVQDSISDIKSVLNKGALGSEVLDKALFSSPDASKIKAIRAVLDQENPALWRDVVGFHFDKALNDSFETVAGGKKIFNGDKFAAVFSKLGGADDSALSAMLEGTSVEPKTFKSMLDAAKILNASDVKIMESPAKKALLKRFLVLVSATSNAVRLGNADILLAHLGRDQSIARVLSNTPIEELLTGIPKDQKSGIRTLIEGAIQKAGQVDKSLKQLPSKGTKNSIGPAFRQGTLDEVRDLKQRE